MNARTWKPKTRAPSRFLNGIDFWVFPIIQVVLLLIFIVELTPDVHLHRPVDLAPADHSVSLPSADREDALSVAVTRDGNVFFRDRQVRLSNLGDEIQKGIRDGARKEVFIRADARAKYGDVAVVVDAIRRVGVEKISFITEQRQSNR